jgi:hypothetical protein
MALPAKAFYGAVPKTTLATTINSGALSIVISSATGWPTTGPFVCVLERGTTNEEKILVASRSGTTLTVTTRGYDGTSAVSHTGGASTFIEHVLDADTLTQAYGVPQLMSTAQGAMVGGTAAGSFAKIDPAGAVIGQFLMYDTAQTPGARWNYAGLVYGSAGLKPGSPSKGQVWYETDTGNFVVYYGATTTWKPPWALPWGRIGSARASADQTGIGVGPTDITSLTVTFTAVANRGYRVTAGIFCLQNTSTGVQTFQIRTSGGTLLGDTLSGVGVAAATNSGLLVATPDLSFGAGSTTVKATLGTTAGTVNVVNSAFNGWILVEDVGPTGAVPGS